MDACRHGEFGKYNSVRRREAKSAIFIPSPRDRAIYLEGGGFPAFHHRRIVPPALEPVSLVNPSPAPPAVSLRRLPPQRKAPPRKSLPGAAEGARP